MALTPEKYEKLKAALADPNKEFSDEFRERAQAALEATDNDFMARGAAAGEKPLAPGESMRVLNVGQPRAAAPDPDAARVQAVIRQLDPSMPLQPQVLAIQPATTHPGGDEAAKEEWIRGDLDNPNGLVVAHDLPAAEVRKKLLENPALFAAIGFSAPADRAAVMDIKAGDATHQAFNDYFFRQAAEAATKAGKTIYRRSKAPWLSEGNGAGFLKTLKTKYDTMPADAPQAFVLGYDDTANFGAGKAAQESGIFGPDEEDMKYMRGPRRGPSFETVGGTPEGLSAQERNDINAEEHPIPEAAGQVLGALAPWSVANRAWSYLTSGGAATTVLGGAARGAGRGALAGAADQTAREGVQAASSYATTGDSGTTVGDSSERILASAMGAAIPMAVGGAARGAAHKVGEEVRWGDRYGGAPGRVEAHGIEPKLLKGHEAPPVVKEAELRGRKEGGRSPLTVLASDLNEPLGDAARFHRANTEMASAEKAAEHYGSPEGAHTLPVRNLVEASVERLRKLTSDVPKEGIKGVARPRTESPIRDILSSNIEGVSTRKTKTGIPISAKEARAFLSPQWQEKLDLEKLEGKNATVYVTPRRYDSQHADEVIEQLGKSADDDVAAVYEAAIRDRESRGGGKWAAERASLDEAEGKAGDTARRVGADQRRGPRRAVIRAGSSKAEDGDIPALRETARRAGGEAPEQLRGALVAEDLGKLRTWASVGSQSPRGGQRGLMGLSALGDMAMLRGIYPLATKLEKTAPGAAVKAARAGSTVARSAADDRADDRRKARDDDRAKGYGERAEKAKADEDAAKPKPKRLRFKRRKENRETP